MTQQDANKLLNDRYNAELSGMVFPESEIPVDFAKWVSYSLPHHNIYTLQCSLDLLLAIRRKPASKYNMLEMINAINAVQQTIPNQFPRCWQPDEKASEFWEKAQEGAYAMSQHWTEITTPIQERIKNEVQAEYDAACRKDDEEKEAAYRKEQLSKSLTENNIKGGNRKIVRSSPYK